MKSTEHEAISERIYQNIENILDPVIIEDYGSNIDILLPRKVYALPLSEVEKWSSRPTVKVHDDLEIMQVGPLRRNARLEIYRRSSHFLGYELLAYFIELQVQHQERIPWWWVYQLELGEQKLAAGAPKIRLINATTSHYEDIINDRQPAWGAIHGEVPSLGQLVAFERYVNYVKDKKPVKESKHRIKLLRSYL